MDANHVALSAVQQWLHDFKTVSEVELAGFAKNCRQNEELFHGIEAIIDVSSSQEELMPIFQQLFLFFRHSSSALFWFALEFLPCIIHRYLKVTQSRLHCVQVFDALESYLLGLYNVAVTKERQRGLEPSYFNIPAIGVNSVYHDGVARPGHFTDAASADSDRSVPQETFPHLDNVTAESRFKMLRYLQRCFNNDLVFLSPLALQSFCRRCTNLIDMKSKPRLSLETGFMQELLVAIYFGLFNGPTSLAMTALNCIEQRATYDMICEVLLVVNAIKNSVDSNPSGAPHEGPMGVRLHLTFSPGSVISESIVSSSQRNRSSFTSSDNLLRTSEDCSEELSVGSKSYSRAITNASFKAKKLPEDIPLRLVGGRGVAPVLVEDRVTEYAAVSSSEVHVSFSHHNNNGSGSGSSNVQPPSKKQSRSKLLTKASTKSSTLSSSGNNADSNNAVQFDVPNEVIASTDF